MLSNWFTKPFLLALSVVFLTVVSSGNSTQAQVINLDLSGIVVAAEEEGGEEEEGEGLTLANALRYVDAVRRGQAFWNARVLGYSNTLPREIQAQLPGGLLIFVSNEDIPVAGVLGQAGVDTTTVIRVVRGTFLNTRQVAVGTLAIFTLDDDFIANSTDDELTDVAIHEFGHALGIGTLWNENGLVQQFGFGPGQYVGVEGRRAFAIESGAAGLARTGFVPVEQSGGPGTAGSHWDDDEPTFNTIATNGRIEILTGFFVPNTERFLSRTTLGSLVDLHYVVRGFNEDELIQFPGQNVAFGPSTDAFFSSGSIANQTGFNANPFGANRALEQSNASKQPRRAPSVYKTRRR